MQYSFYFLYFLIRSNKQQVGSTVAVESEINAEDAAGTTRTSLWQSVGNVMVILLQLNLQSEIIGSITLHPFIKRHKVSDLF